MQAVVVFNLHQVAENYLSVRYPLLSLPNTGLPSELLPRLRCNCAHIGHQEGYGKGLKTDMMQQTFGTACW